MLDHLAHLGYAIRYELIALIDPTSAVAEILQPAGQVGGQGSLNIHAYRNQLFAALGLADQRHDLTYPGPARNVDLDVNQVAELLGPRRFRKFARPKPPVKVTPQALRATRWVLRQMGGRTFLIAGTLLTARNRHTMMTTRNRLTVDDALELADHGSDVALIWGAGHLPDRSASSAEPDSNSSTSNTGPRSPSTTSPPKRRHHDDHPRVGQNPAPAHAERHAPTPDPRVAAPHARMDSMTVTGALAADFWTSPGLGGVGAVLAAVVAGSIAWISSSRQRATDTRHRRIEQWWDRYTWLVSTDGVVLEPKGRSAVASSLHRTAVELKDIDLQQAIKAYRDVITAVIIDEARRRHEGGDPR